MLSSFSIHNIVVVGRIYDTLHTKRIHTSDRQQKVMYKTNAKLKTVINVSWTDISFRINEQNIPAAANVMYNLLVKLLVMPTASNGVILTNG